jgi:hypothetical protein
MDFVKMPAICSSSGKVIVRSLFASLLMAVIWSIKLSLCRARSLRSALSEDSTFWERESFFVRRNYAMTSASFLSVLVFLSCSFMKLDMSRGLIIITVNPLDVRNEYKLM